MAALTTKYDLDINGTQHTHVWKSITLSTGDTLGSGFKDVWAVWISDPTKFATPSWAAAANTGVVTFTLTGPFTGTVVILGR